MKTKNKLPESLRKQLSAAGKASAASMTPQQRIERAKRAWEARVQKHQHAALRTGAEACGRTRL